MYKKILTLTFLLLANISAMDLNETTGIINEATQATQTLQNEFTTLVNEVEIPMKKETVQLDNNHSLLPIIETMPILELNESIEKNITTLIMVEEVFEHNNTFLPKINEKIEINSTIMIEELNSSKKLSCKETNVSNISIQANELNTTTNIDDLIDLNNSVPDNGCTDTVQGTSIRGLIIFKTRIKPYCEINGDKFAKQYMQEDWDDIYHEKEFKMEVLKACPKIEKRYKDKWTPHLYQFTLEYASDSDAIPDC